MCLCLFWILSNKLDLNQENRSTIIESKQKDKGTQLHIASGNGQLEVVEGMIEKGADIGSKDILD